VPAAGHIVMAIHPRRCITMSVLAALLPAVLCAEQREPAEEPRVTLAKGADLQAVVAALSRAINGVVVADSTPLRQTLRQPLQDAPLSKTLEQVSIDFDRHWVLQGKTIALQCRYSDAAEGPGLEVEELRATLNDLYRLISPFSRPIDTHYTEDQNSFANSLTPEQEQMMMKGGLSFSQLPPAQQRAWLRVNAAFAYSPHIFELWCGKLCIEVWPRVIMADADPVGGRLQKLNISYPIPAPSTGMGPLPLMVPGPNRRPRPARSDGEVLPPAPARFPGALQPPWRLEATELSPVELAAELEAAGGPTLATPSYARHRRLWICSPGAPRGEALDAVSLLWGWTRAPAQEGVRLAQPSFAPAKDPVDLLAKMRASLPPGLRHMAAAVMDDVATEPWGEQIDLILQAAEAVGGKNWTKLRVEQLDETAQRRLANQVARLQVGRWYHVHGNQAQPPAWLAHPELGVFILNEENAPGRQPKLLFRVMTGPSSMVGWGWGIDTRKLPPKPGP
jgi:hypothetical protein